MSLGFNNYTSSWKALHERLLFLQTYSMAFQGACVRVCRCVGRSVLFLSYLICTPPPLHHSFSSRFALSLSLSLSAYLQVSLTPYLCPDLWSHLTLHLNLYLRDDKPWRKYSMYALYFVYSPLFGPLFSLDFTVRSLPSTNSASKPFGIELFWYPNSLDRVYVTKYRADNSSASLCSLIRD